MGSLPSSHCTHLWGSSGTRAACLPSTSPVFGVPGGPGRPEDLTEEVDILPEGQAHLLPAGQQPRLQCSAGRLRPQVSGPEGARVLRGLHPAAVSAPGGQGWGVCTAGSFPTAPLHPAPHLRAVTSPPPPQEQRGAVGRVRLQPVHGRGGLLPWEVYAERNGGTVPHQVGALQRGCAHAAAWGGEWARASPWEWECWGHTVRFLGPFPSACCVTAVAVNCPNEKVFWLAPDVLWD